MLATQMQMSHFPYTPSVHFRTILCNMLPRSGFANFDDQVLDQIKEELIIVLGNFNLEMNDCCVHHVAKAMKRLNLTKHTIIYKHEIYYLITDKPRPVVTKEQEAQMVTLFESHENNYKIGNNYEYIIRDIDKKLEFNLFVNL